MVENGVADCRARRNAAFGNWRPPNSRSRATEAEGACRRRRHVVGIGRRIWPSPLLRVQAGGRGVMRVRPPALACMMLVTLVDVNLRQMVNLRVFWRKAELELAWLSWSTGFPADLHGGTCHRRAIDPHWPRTAVRTVAAALTLAFLVAMGWRMVAPALDTLDFGDSTMDLRLPLIWYWAPMILGVACGAAAMALVLLFEAVRIFTGGAPPGATVHDT